MEPQLPSDFRTGTESIQKLEESLYKREEIIPEDEKPNPPRFTVELKVPVYEYCIIYLFIFIFTLKINFINYFFPRMSWMRKKLVRFTSNAELNRLTIQH